MELYFVDPALLGDETLPFSIFQGPSSRPMAQTLENDARCYSWKLSLGMVIRNSLATAPSNTLLQHTDRV